MKNNREVYRLVKQHHWRQRVNPVVLMGIVAANLALVILLAGFTLSAAAQSSPLKVYLTQVDAASFPEVEAQLAVTGADGQSITDLQADQIQLQEDDEPSSGSVRVEAVTLDDLQLVLALDVSMSPGDLDQLKRAVQPLLDEFDNLDCLALVTFGDKVTPQTQCSNNKESVQTLLDGLRPEANLTKLHEAIFEAAEIIEPEADGRQAVILITDRHDNANTVSLAQAINRAQETEVPFYIIGVGPQVQKAHDVKTEITSTGGRYLTVADIGQVEPALAELVADLRRGYRVTFRSMLKADNDVHSFKLQITRAEGSGQAAGQFTAVPNEVLVTLPENLTELRVKGQLPLTPTITSPAPVASVTYWVDGQPLAERTSPSFTYAWDNTSAESGQHTLTVTVVDIAGNKGETETTINLAKPLSIAEIVLPTTTIPYGEAFTVEVTRTAGLKITNAELLIDNTSIISSVDQVGDDTRFIFNVATSDFDEGVYTISLRATDVLGQSAEKSATVTFTVPVEKTWLDWLSEFLAVSVATLVWAINLSIDILIVLLALIVVLFLLLIDLGIIRRTLYVHRQITRKRYVLDIANNGNIESHYELWADDPAKQLKFEFTLDGNRLPHRPKEDDVEADLDPAAEPVDEPVITPTPSTRPLAPTGTAASTGSRPAAAPGPNHHGQPNVANVGAAGRQIKGFITPLAGALRTAGRMLGPFGGPLRQISSFLTAGQSAVQRAVQKPKQLASQGQQFSRQMSQVTSAAGPPPARPANPPPPPTRPEPITQPLAPVAAPAQPAPAAQVATLPAPSQTTPAKRSRLSYHSIANPAETLKVLPGRSLSVEVWVTPPSPYKPLRSPFTLYSQPVEQVDPLVDQPGLVEIAGLNWVQRWWLLATVGLMTLLLIIGTGYLAYWAMTQIDFLSLLPL